MPKMNLEHARASIRKTGTYALFVAQREAMPRRGGREAIFLTQEAADVIGKRWYL